MKKSVVVTLLIVLALFFTSLVLAESISEDLHINLQTTNSSGDVVTGTFSFVFNISTTADCANVVYTNSTSLTTDSRGIISYYLPNVSLDYDEQYYLCYYRDGSLKDSTKIVRTPYTFTAKNITLSGIEPDSNFNMGAYNMTANYYFGNGTYLKDVNDTLSQLNCNDDQVVKWNDTSSLWYCSNVAAAGEPLWTGNVSIFNSSWLSTYNQTTNDTLTNAINAVAAIGEPLWTANYSTFLTHITWAEVMNGTLATVAYVDLQNASVVNWATSTFTSLSDIVDQVGNWSADKGNYYNITQIAEINTSMLNYVDFQNTSQTNLINLNNVSMKNYVDGTFVTQGEVGDLNVNNSEYLDGYDSTFFMPLNTTVYGQFDFNGGWLSNGLTILDGDLYAQTGYFYNVSSLSVSNLNINGSLLPTDGFDGQFDIGSALLRWKDMYLSGQMNSVTANVTDTLYVGEVNISARIAENNASMKNYVDLQNTSLKNYVNFQNTSQTNLINLNNVSMKNYVDSQISASSYDDSWINETIYNKTQVDTNITNANTSMKNYVDFQNTSQTNYINWNNESVTNAINAVAAAGEPLWTANYTAFNASWSNMTNASYMTGSNFTIQNTSMKNYVDLQNTSLKNYVDSKGYGTGSLTGAGTLNYVPMWNGTSSLNNSVIYQLGLKVGIGTTTPTGPLQVVIPSWEGNNKDYVVFGPGGGYIDGIQFAYNFTDDFGIIDVGISGVEVGDLILQRNGGNVGIGTLNPFTTLHVNGNVLANGTINATTDLCIQGGVCLSGVAAAGEPLWTANYTAFNASWSNMTNASYMTGSNFTLQNISMKNYIASVNTSMKNYVNVQNTSMYNYVNWNNESVTNAINAVAAAGEPLWEANYSTFLTHISWSNIINGTIWSWVMNGTLFQTSQWNATNTSYLVKTGDTMTGNLNLSANVNLTMNGGNQVSSNVTCVIIEGSTSVLEIC